MADMNAFLASAEHRRTDVRVLEVILHVADGNESEADRIWRTPTEMELIDIYVVMQARGLDPDALEWSTMGLLWSRAIQEII